MILGLVSGIIVFVVALTGSIYAFQDEIQNATQPHRFIKENGQPYLPPSFFMEEAKKVLPGKQIHSVLYPELGKSVQVVFYHHDPVDYHIVYFHPQTGQLLAAVDEKKGFFRFILDGHFYLWLPEKIGQPTVAIATLIFLILLITGLVLWWPKNRQVAAQRFSIKWNSKNKRRLNFDLHTVTGFYVFLLGLVFVITGLVWGFSWFAKTYYSGITGETFKDYELPQGQIAVTHQPLDQLWKRLHNSKTANNSIEYHLPPHDFPDRAIAVNINPDPGTYWQTDYRYFNPATLEEMKVDHPWGSNENLSAGKKLFRMNYDIHVGAVAGLAGKTLMCLCSLLIASLPVTGGLMWYKRRYGKKKYSRSTKTA